MMWMPLYLLEQSLERYVEAGLPTLKQTTLDAALSLRHSRPPSIAASASVQSMADDEDILDSDSNDETEKYDSSSDDALPLQGKGRKRVAPRGKGRGFTTASKRGRKSYNSSASLQRLLTIRDDDDDILKKLSTPQPRVTRNYGALRMVAIFPEASRMDATTRVHVSEISTTRWRNFSVILM